SWIITSESGADPGRSASITPPSRRQAATRYGKNLAESVFAGRTSICDAATATAAPKRQTPIPAIRSAFTASPLSRQTAGTAPSQWPCLARAPRTPCLLSQADVLQDFAMCRDIVADSLREGLA